MRPAAAHLLRHLRFMMAALPRRRAAADFQSRFPLRHLAEAQATRAVPADFLLLGESVDVQSRSLFGVMSSIRVTRVPSFRRLALSCAR